MKLLHIVPCLPPEIDGLGDFATRLGEVLEVDFGIDNLFLSAGPSQQTPNTGFLLREQSSESLARQLSELDHDCVLLHYSGYGYDLRGVPEWLVDGLEAARSARGFSLGIFFHELWASSPPWKSPFYFLRAQKSVVRRLQRLAAFTLTSTPRMKRLLEQAGADVILSPVPSNIPPVGAARERDGDLSTAIIFGQEHTRERSVRAHARLLRSLAGSGRLKQLKLIGKNASSGSSDYQAAAVLLGPERIVAAPDKSAEEIALELGAAGFCLSFYPLDYLTKSGTIMAAFACGCPVILPAQTSSESFTPFPPVLLCHGSEAAISSQLRPENLARVSAEALAWYDSHASWDQLSRKLGSALGLHRDQSKMRA